MYEMQFKMTVLASGYCKEFTTREAAVRFAEVMLGLAPGAYKIEGIGKP